MSPPTRISVLRRGFARVWPLLFAWPPRQRLSREEELARAFEDLADGDDYLREVAEYLRRQRPFSRG